VVALLNEGQYNDHHPGQGGGLQGDKMRTVGRATETTSAAITIAAMLVPIKIARVS